jgi:hypothetical protein
MHLRSLISGSHGSHRAIAACLCLALVGGVAACGEEEETHVVEGEPIELGHLRINVQITRFLNPALRDDSEYLLGQPPPPTGEDYLAVFMEIENESDEPAELPGAEDIEITDTTGATYRPIPVRSPFALPLGEEIPGGSEVPAADTAASSGPIQGSFVLFLVDESVSENRPLELQLEAGGEQGTVQLDI